MIGKINIVFGFIFLAFTASLGPLMVNMYEDYAAATGEKQQYVGRLQSLMANDFEEELEPLTADQISRANTAGILSINKLLNTESAIDSIKGGPHAHGNLESLLNIVVGIVLGLLTIAAWLKYLISGLFIVGTLMHSGMLYLATVFNSNWAASLLETGIGPICILAGLLITGIACIFGLKDDHLSS